MTTHMRRTALGLLVMMVLSLGLSAQLTDLQKIDAALALLSTVTPAPTIDDCDFEIGPTFRSAWHQ